MGYSLPTLGAVYRIQTARAGKKGPPLLFHIGIADRPGAFSYCLLQKLLILGHYHDLQLLMPFCHSRQSREGVSHSIRAGILAEMPGSSPISGMCRQEAGREPDAYVFFVADQPWLSERTVETFLEFMKKVSDGDRESHPIGCISCLGEPGNPVWFSAFYKDELLALSGDRGGKRVMKAHMDQVHFFEVEEERELWDVDTLEDQAGR